MSEEPQSQPELRASDADRERVAQLLHTAMSEGRITMDELEERLTTVYAAKTFNELTPITADLPGATNAVAPATPRAAAPNDLVGGTPGSATSIAVMSGADRKGKWVVPVQHNSFAFWGGVDIDLREARFAERFTTITCVAIMGGIDIIVPDDVKVEITGVGIMGAFEEIRKDGDDLAEPPPGAPVVRINGLAFWGGVDIKRKPSKRRQIEG